MKSESIVICPVYNEEKTIQDFSSQLRKYYSGDVLFIDDGSNDRTGEFLYKVKGKDEFIIHHPNRFGYGAALISGLNFSKDNSYRKIITIDADLQHNPKNIPLFLKELEGFDVVLGSRYIKKIRKEVNVPVERFRINRHISSLMNMLFGIVFTDPFCGFRGYRESFLKKAVFKEHGYGFALDVILEMIRTRILFKEIPVEIIYNDTARKFLDGMDDPEKRLNYYLEIVYSKKKEIENEKECSYCKSSS